MVKLIYYTPDLHKLVEMIARVCYQSYDKLSPDSHKMVKGIMNKGHLSVASSGNMVFEFSVDPDKVDMEDILLLLDSLTTFKQINNFIRWTTPSHKGARPNVVTVSMNILTLLDIVNNIHDFDIPLNVLDSMLREVKNVPCLHWFLDSSVEIEPKDNPYEANPFFGHPVVLTQDYTALKEQGLTDYELDIHATVTVDLVTDRATGLQMWRHVDMAGGCELSQRYVDRSNASVRSMPFYPAPDKLKEYADKEEITMEEAEEHVSAVFQSIQNHNRNTVKFYTDVNDTLKMLGVSPKRAKEVARSVLPNAMSTRIIQCRPLRQWKHFFDLRDSVHAQPEIQEDARAIKQAFIKAGVEIG